MLCDTDHLCWTVSCNLHRWDVARSGVHDCEQQQAVNCAVVTCLLTEFVGRLQSLDVVKETEAEMPSLPFLAGDSHI